MLCLCFYLTLIIFLADKIIDNNQTADLQKYIKGASEFGKSYFEPFSLFYFECINFISIKINSDWLLSCISAFIFFIFIFYRTKFNFSLKIFWFFTLGLIISLINVRYIVVILLILFLPFKKIKYLLFLAHWNLIFLFIPQNIKLNSVIKFIFFLIPILSALYFFGNLDFIFLKLSYYILHQKIEFGIGIFLEIILVFSAFKNIYLKANKEMLLFNLSLGLALVFAILGMPINSSRLVTFTLLISLLDLYESTPVRLSDVSKISLVIISFYEIYRVVKMI